jgi:hypothetical protein
MRAALTALTRKNYFVTIISLVVLFGATAAIADIVSGLATTNSSTNVTITNLTLTKPSDVAAGDVMLASIALHDGSATSVTAPTGWTQVLRTDNDTNIGIVSYYKVAGASEPSTYTWTLSPQTRAQGGITRYSGVDTSHPIDTAAGNIGRSKVATTSPVTATSTNEEIVAVYAIHQGSSNFTGDFFSAPTGMTEKYDSSYTTAGPTIASFDATQASSGVSGSKSSTISGNPNQQRDWASQQIALRRFVPVPTILDTLPTSVRHTSSGESFTYTVPSGSNTALILISFGLDGAPTTTYNGVAPDFVNYYGVQARAHDSYAYWINPPAGTHTFVTDLRGEYMLFTVGGVDQSSPIAANAVKNETGVTSASDSLTTTSGSTLLLAQALFINAPDTTVTFGTDQTEITHSLDADSVINPLWASFRPVSNSSGSETMSESWSGSHQYDLITLALRAVN